MPCMTTVAFEIFHDGHERCWPFWGESTSVTGVSVRSATAVVQKPKIESVVGQHDMPKTCACERGGERAQSQRRCCKGGRAGRATKGGGRAEPLSPSWALSSRSGVRVRRGSCAGSGRRRARRRERARLRRVARRCTCVHRSTSFTAPGAARTIGSSHRSVREGRRARDAIGKNRVHVVAADDHACGGQPLRGALSRIRRVESVVAVGGDIGAAHAQGTRAPPSADCSLGAQGGEGHGSACGIAHFASRV